MIDIQNLNCQTIQAGNDTLSDDPKFDSIFAERRSECSNSIAQKDQIKFTAYLILL